MRGHIRQRSPGSWQIVADTGRDEAGRRLQHRETIRGPKREAERRLSELLTEVQRGGYVHTPHDLTLGDYLRAWLKSYVQLNCAPKTVESYSQLVNTHVIPEIGSIRLVDLKPAQLQAFYGRKKDSGLSSRTVRYLYSLLVEALGHALKAGTVSRNVALATEAPRVTHKPIGTLSPENLAIFFETAQNSQHYALFYLLAHTGLRRGEALALKWRDIDMGLASLGVQAYISVSQSLGKVNGEEILKEPKTLSGKRRVALSPSLTLVLRQHRTQQEALRRVSEGNYVFCHLDGSPLDPSTISHAFANIIRKAGLPPMPMHGLRHSHATLLLQAGTHPRIVMERLGHSSIRVTLDTYSHVVGGLQEAAAQRFDEFLSARASQGNVAKMLPKPQG